MSAQPIIEDESPAIRATRERAEAKEREDSLFAWTCTVVDGMFRLGRREAPERAQGLLAQYVAKAAHARDLASALQDRIDELTGRSAALEMRALTLSRIIDHHVRRRTYENEDGPTAETAAKPKRRDPVLVLVDKGHLTYAHQTAAREIAECFELACKAGMARARNYEVVVPPPKKSGRAPDNSPLNDLDHRHAGVYLPWTNEIYTRKGIDISFVFDVVVDGYSLKAASRYHRMGWNHGLKDLRAALEIWGEFMEQHKTDEPGPRS